MSGRFGVLLRVAMFLVFGYIALRLLAVMLYPAFGLLIASVGGAFAGASIANALAIRIYERGALADIGLHWNRASARNLLCGVAGGMGAVAIIVVPALLTGAAWFEKTPGDGASPGGVLFLALVLLFGAVGEEMLFRGYGFQVLVPVFGKAPTVLPMAVLFAAVHAGNPDVSRLALFNTFAWGVLLGWALLRSGDLWFPIGIHYGWNLALPLVGVNVSGFTMKLTDFTLRWRVSHWWSGGDYGLEGGLLCTLVLVLVMAFLRRAPVHPQRLWLVEGASSPRSVSS
jgi:membrane protease YdiL (CAAX protease family)